MEIHQSHSGGSSMGSGASSTTHGPMGDPLHTHHWNVSEHGSIHDKVGAHIGTLEGDKVIDRVSGHGLTIGQHGDLYSHGNKVGKVEHDGNIFRVKDEDGHHIATVSAGHGEGPAKYATGAMALLKHMHH